MILTDREIQAALSSDQLAIDPPPRADAFSSTSVDLTLAPTIRIWNPADTPGVEPEIFNPGVPGFQSLAVLQKHTTATEIPDEGRTVEPGNFLLAWTAERIELRAEYRLAARVEGKSSLARLGIGVHVTAPTIHAGFRGPIQLEIFNHGPIRVRLNAGMPVCQLIFEQTLGTPEKGYSGQFLEQEPA